MIDINYDMKCFARIVLVVCEIEVAHFQIMHCISYELEDTHSWKLGVCQRFNYHLYRGQARPCKSMAPVRSAATTDRVTVALMQLLSTMVV